MTFEIHDAFKVGDEVKNKENGIIGRVVFIEEYNVLYPYKVKNQDGSVNIHTRNGIVMNRESKQTQAFKLYDKVEVIDPQDPLFGKKGLIAYVDIQEGKETKYRIQNEGKTHRWYAYESQLKLVSDEKEEVKTNKTDPSHYKNQSIEVWDMMIRIWGEEKFIAFCEMNAFKYRMRLGSKQGESIDDEIKKAKRYEQKGNELKNRE